ncbi:T9SS type A sorting domain-containing protein [candidate division KSB1 bacterium]|nr:T9SS type A sorting domain-containing protein [candidate division KSB1 bacterium]
MPEQPQVGNTEYSYTDHTTVPGESYTYRLSDVDVQGKVTVLQEIAVSTTEISSLSNAVVPARTELLPAYPNPFNPETTISYQLATNAAVNIAVFNMAGQQVRTLVVNEARQAGAYHASWDARTNTGEMAPSGVYLIVLRSGSVVQSQKVVLML